MMKNDILNIPDGLIIQGHTHVGNDLVFIPDFQKSLTEDFKRKVYTSNELAYCERFDDSIIRYASTWAAKEAVYKALKQFDPSAISWKKIEISREKIAGKPAAIIHGQKLNYTISLSISHDGEYAWAIALLMPGI
ncbi:holo-[acyl-carrier protein] synthase [Daejeonella rubra]|uniref:Holo-[acyl-carrier-protein] synthase n=1 Tax=Daejeonella rubra TaxID=990371 RepID=A0A1G9Z3K0_9SPHI|nr:holo-ACP synthase [Daejeonella rubra]SDN15900.1 holo-[acyl-carrier protein] synthase [Daejeonella rubra]